jgi:hypothetical protein
MPRHHFLISVATCVVMTGMTSCGSLENTGYLYQTAAAAHDHIMLVRESPPTFGYERLQALSRHYPDLAAFIEKQGLPRYYAETTSGGGRYWILYYPLKREAYACRSVSNSSRQIEFSGPYPITKNELTTLQKLEVGEKRDFKP